MAALIISGGNPLYGKIKMQGSKNAVLPLMAASLVIPGKTTLLGCPRISDVFAMTDLLRKVGAKVLWQEDTLCIDASVVQPVVIGQEDTKSTRACILLLGALISRCRSAVMAYPGGCAIGKRPVDIHLAAFKQLKVCVTEGEQISCDASKLCGAEISLTFPSVGATQNIVLAAVCGRGVTRIHNAAREPEVAWLCRFLVQAGAKISGIGTAHLLIEGVERLHEITFSVPPDRIVTGTYLAAVMSAGGEIQMTNVCPEELTAVIRPIVQAGGAVRVLEKEIIAKKRGRLAAFDYLCTEPYPGFPTDMQSLFLALAATANGTSVIEEKIFEARFGVAKELARLGARIWVDGACALVDGQRTLRGNSVHAGDLRGAAALLVAALGAEGTTQLTGVEFLERGYENIWEGMSGLGADIRME